MKAIVTVNGNTHGQTARVFTILSKDSVTTVQKNMKGFNSLDLYYKSDLLKQQADYLLTIETDGYSIKLYSWDSFFIEQYFDDEQRVTKINIAKNLDMQKYLKVISLGDLGYPTVV